MRSSFVARDAGRRGTRLATPEACHPIFAIQWQRLPPCTNPYLHLLGGVPALTRIRHGAHAHDWTRKKENKKGIFLLFFGAEHGVEQPDGFTVLEATGRTNNGHLPSIRSLVVTDGTCVSVVAEVPRRQELTTKADSPLLSARPVRAQHPSTETSHCIGRLPLPVYKTWVRVGSEVAPAQNTASSQGTPDSSLLCKPLISAARHEFYMCSEQLAAQSLRIELHHFTPYARGKHVLKTTLHSPDRPSSVKSPTLYRVAPSSVTGHTWLNHNLSQPGVACSTITCRSLVLLQIRLRSMWRRIACGL